MFYEVEIREHVRVDPSLFGLNVKEAIKKELEESYATHISPELGIVVCVVSVKDVGEGIIIPGDGAAYYDTQFTLLTFIPELQEVLYGTISEITSFGAFMNLGPIDGMIHISQTMDDYVNFSKTNVLTGRNSKRNLKKNDLCLARVIALSYKNPKDPRIGLTMRQPGLGKLEWIQQDRKKAIAELKKVADAEKLEEKKQEKAAKKKQAKEAEEKTKAK